MSVWLPSDTWRALGVDAALCDQRTLLLERYGAPPERGAREAERLARIVAWPALPHRQKAWRNLLLHGLRIAPENLLFAKLQARLSLSGGLAPAAAPGLCLDRLTGAPWIPGAAAKGCARQAAVRELSDAAGDETKAQLLERIARVFGWNIEARAAGSNEAQACGAAWPQIAAAAARRLDKAVGLDAPEIEPAGPRSLPTIAGRVQFLPACPWESPSPDLEVEVRSDHHPGYYAREKPLAQAPDVETPRLDFYPVVAAGHVFAFGLRGPRPEAEWALRWLALGLREWGLGAGTAAGFGWFDTSDALQDQWRRQIRQAFDQETMARRQQDDEQQRQEQKKAVEQSAAASRERLSAMSPEEKEDFELSQLTDEQFRARLQYFTRQLTPRQQAAVVRALRGERAAFWDDLKSRAARGGPWAHVEMAIRQVSKKIKLGRMP